MWADSSTPRPLSVGRGPKPVWLRNGGQVVRDPIEPAREVARPAANVPPELAAVPPHGALDLVAGPPHRALALELRRRRVAAAFRALAVRCAVVRVERRVFVWVAICTSPPRLSFV